MFFHKISVLIITFALSCSPVTEENSADSTDSQAVASASSNGREATFEIGQSWTLMNSSLPQKDPKSFQLVSFNDQPFLVNLDKDIQLWEMNAAKSWGFSEITTKDKVSKIYDAINMQGILHIVAHSQRGLSIYKINSEKKLDLVDFMPSDEFDFHCVASEEDELHFYARGASDVYLKHWSWKFGKSFRVEVTNGLQPSKAPFSCAQKFGKSYVLFHTDIENKRTSPLWSGNEKGIWKKTVHDVSGDLGHASLQTTEKGLVVVGNKAVMKSENGTEWRYYQSVQVDFAEHHDSFQSQNYSWVIAKSNHSRQPVTGIWRLKNNSKQNSGLVLKPYFQRAATRVGEWINNFSHANLSYSMVWNSGEVSIFSNTEPDHRAHSTFSAQSASDVQVDSHEGQAFLLNRQTSPAKLLASSDLKSWSDFVSIPVDSVSCYGIVDGLHTILSSTEAGIKIHQLEDSNPQLNNWTEKLVDNSKDKSIERCFFDEAQIQVILRARSGDFEISRIGSNGSNEMDTQAVKFWKQISDISQVFVVHDEGKLTLISSHHLYHGHLKKLISTEAMVPSQFLSGRYNGEQLILDLPSVIPNFKESFIVE